MATLTGIDLDIDWAEVEAFVEGTIPALLFAAAVGWRFFRKIFGLFMR